MRTDNDDPDQQAPNGGPRIPIAGIGASAGSITALQIFFRALPNKTGAAYVVIVHLDPLHQSELAHIIQSCTEMPVLQVDRTHQIEADTVYVIPPNRRLLVTADEISTAPFDEPRGRRAPIDLFFRSLAEQHGDGFAIILTGAGSDGAVGVKQVKENGGLILVQDPNEAEFPSMPRSAIASGVADFVLPLREIAGRMGELVRLKKQLQAEQVFHSDEQSFGKIITTLRQKTGHDFSNYKRPTVVRRVARRMQVMRVDKFDDYAALIKDNPAEVEALFSDLLISVTRFFRDTAAFHAVAKTVVPKLFHDRAVGGPIRVWVAGCATGEEAYSLAILLLEEAGRRGIRPDLQIFASDLDGAALQIAREGVYPLSIAADVSEERLQRFFIGEGEQYRVRREVRDVIVFASHSLLRDPPFSHIDLISCRNLLIYLDRDLQQQVSSTFLYALRPEGYLFIGASETIDTSTHFRVLDRDWRIYQALRRAHDKMPALPRALAGPHVPDEVRKPARPKSATASDMNVHKVVLEAAAPPSMLVNADYLVLTLSESAGRYLMHSGGPMTNAASDIVRPELRLDLRAGLQRAFLQGEQSLSVPVAVAFNGHARHVVLQVRPVETESGRAALVLFIEGGVVDRVTEIDSAEAPPAIVEQLKQELRTVRDHLGHSRDQYEAVTEELSASNEELQSMNEEYRSTAEELETSKEELQSINEELQTLNSELKNKLESISRAHSDLQNLMAATDVATLFLDPMLRINRFTPRVMNIFSILPGDEGRPITDFSHRLAHADLPADARRVLADLTPLDRTLKSDDGNAWMMRIRPYRTIDDRIEGVIVTFVDITKQQQAQELWSMQQQSLVEELARRTRSVQAVIGLTAQTLRQTGASTPVLETLFERLSALARSHDLLLHEQTVAMQAFARHMLSEHLKRGQIRLNGPDIQIPADVGIALGLILNDLATAAFAQPNTHTTASTSVDLQWQQMGSDRSSGLTIVWRADRHDLAASEARAKLGSPSIDQILANLLPVATLTRTIEADGERISIDMPWPSGPAHKPASPKTDH